MPTRGFSINSIISYALKSGIANSSKAHLIVDVIYSLRSESFYFIKLHLVFQCSLVEKLLQLFITVIDAKLLKGVVFKVLEACNIKNADEA